MSVFKKLGKVLKPFAGVALGAVGGMVGGPAGAALGQRVGGAIASRGRGRPSPSMPLQMQAMAALPVAFGAAARMLPALGRVGGAVARVATGRAGRAVGRVARDVGTFVIGGIVYDALTGQPIGRRRSKRINPMNVKAMRRSIRRVKAGRKICAEIDRMLPKRRAVSCAPGPAFARRRAKRC